MKMMNRNKLKTSGIKDQRNCQKQKSFCDGLGLTLVTVIRSSFLWFKL